MDSDSSGPTRLTFDFAWDGHPTWSPDGSRILFVSQRSGSYELWTMNADGADQRRISLGLSLVEGYAAVFGNVDDGDDLIDPGAFTKTISESGGRVKMGWQHAAPFGVTTYLAEVPRDALPPAVLARAPGATGGPYVRGQADMTAEDVDRLRRLASGSVDELSIGCEAVKVAFEQIGDRHMRRLKEVKLHEWSPVWVAMDPAALITGVKGASEAGGAGTIDPGEHDGVPGATGRSSPRQCAVPLPPRRRAHRAGAAGGQCGGLPSPPRLRALMRACLSAAAAPGVE